MRLSHAFVMSFGIAACGDNDTIPPDDTAIELQMQVAVPAGAELQYCKFVAIPDAWITHDNIEFTAGSHHVLVYQTGYSAIPTKKTDGTVVDTSGPFDCTDGPTDGWSITKLIAGSQNRDGESVLAFPPGIGVHVGGIALINVHYINGSDAPLDTDVHISLETIPEADVQTEGDILFLYNPLISVPAGHTARARYVCPVYADITIANAQSHMHARGIGYAAAVNTGAPFYTNTNWEGVPVQNYDNLIVKAGSTLDYYCDYRNTDGVSVYQGPKTSDEMCMLLGSYYPADARTANCLDSTGQLPGGDWVGNGTATCQTTMGCIQTAAASGLPAITDCTLAADPSVAHEVSDLLRCFMGASDPASQCGPQISACAAK